MGGSNTQQATTTSSSGSSNAAVNGLVSNLAGKTNTALNAGPKVFDQSLYGGVGDTTKGSWASALGAAGNQDYANGINGALQSYGATAAGANIGQQDPGYMAIRNKLQNDVLTGTNSSFNNSGLFGSDSNQKAAASGLADSLGALDYGQYKDSLTRQDNAAAMLPALFQANQLPGATQGAVGAAQDADKQSALLGQNDLYRRTNDAMPDYLAKITSILNGQAQAGGQTNSSTSTTPSTPWWQSALGLGAALL